MAATVGNFLQHTAPLHDSPRFTLHIARHKGVPQASDSVLDQGRSKTVIGTAKTDKTKFIAGAQTKKTTQAMAHYRVLNGYRENVLRLADN
ncbi:hypothetical protein [Collimonas silvisoli]|uniref:hypothetical protein n=1 Tax=Collimonas silvisoli TaxID=2825884 RepID=UPI001B8B1B7F|nr:hypothetical protein [Collimonas silvisoli]